ncbi:heavy metal transporter [Mycobacterium intermedium]|uniref:Heavy metal transporter n=1 Tax=Mycobacterium intermedium TaxID=28445 RepID=A0A1E3SKG4_MYCIE|nr:heavy metal-associated domain-containing protein [Mycobacterium intermedium]MCV6962933.1 heavy-metal-associated domain-containing protein [Mycobacterium intermedium]ODR02644.1 heavy metal transporter [Mycobacterium intermedium]OPE51966.1 heavy metal transporter [Mycobacterium intermedium]ORB10314.1 heavy metal transporter [Mycobacterium intermedium]
MTEQSFSVDGLKCEGCVETVTNALTALPPVRAVDIDLKANGTSTVRISTDVELTRDEVQAALKTGGDFSVVG